MMTRVEANGTRPRAAAGWGSRRWFSGSAGRAERCAVLAMLVFLPRMAWGAEVDKREQVQTLVIDPLACSIGGVGIDANLEEYKAVLGEPTTTRESIMSEPLKELELHYPSRQTIIVALDNQVRKFGVGLTERAMYGLTLAGFKEPDDDHTFVERLEQAYGQPKARRKYEHMWRYLYKTGRCCVVIDAPLTGSMGVELVVFSNKWWSQQRFPDQELMGACTEGAQVHGGDAH